ncbi:hypothetical protein SAMN02745823_00859 [Sporobacter termitidis DSM 10068]|uniref:Uncharacterized protein n=1 Tax=Sporobacter termitidis DSM 10068 TaxID=1123282 RepID=A0A1M5VJR1_9FIRM|nr:hypothetical protein [Sporobacter termitidis]SHH75304.1 hypothetical protein SAMN02745823_00859 [Sporobacter termitidis DSM 10068]
MKRPKRTVKFAVLLVLALLILAPAGWFTYTRFCVDRYAISMDWETITFKGETYIPKKEQYETDADLQAALGYMNSHVGKNIGIGVFPKRSFTDLIWPVWISEYDGDKSHGEIFVRGLMDVGSVYVRQQ